MSNSNEKLNQVPEVNEEIDEFGNILDDMISSIDTLTEIFERVDLNKECKVEL